jgi:hypothetical protein
MDMAGILIEKNFDILNKKTLFNKSIENIIYNLTQHNLLANHFDDFCSKIENLNKYDFKDIDKSFTLLAKRSLLTETAYKIIMKSPDRALDLADLLWRLNNKNLLSDENIQMILNCKANAFNLTRNVKRLNDGDLLDDVNFMTLMQGMVNSSYLGEIFIRLHQSGFLNDATRQCIANIRLNNNNYYQIDQMNSSLMLIKPHLTQDLCIAILSSVEYASDVFYAIQKIHINIGSAENYSKIIQNAQYAEGMSSVLSYIPPVNQIDFDRIIMQAQHLNMISHLLMKSKYFNVISSPQNTFTSMNMMSILNVELIKIE